MKKQFILFFLIIFCPLQPFLFAHDYPIYPIDLKLRIEPAHMTAIIKSNSFYWTDELLQSPVSLTGAWPDTVQKQAEDFINSYLQLSADGRLIKGKILQCRYIEEPFSDNSDIIYKMKYVLPLGAKELTGKAEFFKEYWLREKESHGQAHLDEMRGEPNKIFRTDISIVGHKNSGFKVPIENPDFNLPIEPNLVTQAEYLKESFFSALWPGIDGVWFAAFLLSALLFLPSRKMLLMGLILLILAESASFLLHVPLGSQVQSIAPAALLLFMSIVTLSARRARIWLAGLLVLSGLWGSIWFSQFKIISEYYPAGAGFQIAHVAGKVLFALVIVSIILGIFWAYRKRQTFLSESMALSICRTHARFATFLLMVVALLQLGRLFSR